MKTYRLGAIASLLLILAGAPFPSGIAHAQATQPPTPDYSLLSPQYFPGNWFAMATETQNEQPHWMTPVVTVTPRLEQELRYDQSWQSMKHGALLTNYGSGKGIELIPWKTIEVILGIPNYQSHEAPGAAGRATRGTDDFADWTALIKYRILSANEEKGNYILTAFMGFSAPTGTSGNSQGHAIFTPTIAGGKGWGDFDIQSTASVALPNGGSDRLGVPVAWNTAFQYHVYHYFWPEVETNYTWFPDGEHAGKNQLYITPGLILGRFPVWERVKLIAGAGFQVAVTKYSGYHNAWVLTGRVTF